MCNLPTCRSQDPSDCIDCIHKSASIISTNNKIKFLQNSNNNQNRSLENKILSAIDNYLQFSSVELFKNTNCLIFGGAVRDSIANQPINDIDILCDSHDCIILNERLLSQKFKQLHKFNMDIACLYKTLIINEPWTYYKNDTFIQLIRPRPVKNKQGSFEQRSLKKVAQQVDISCCGVSFSPPDTLTEHFPNAIQHCLNKKFKVNLKAELLNRTRIDHRVDKLVQRGWTQIDKEDYQNTLLLSKTNADITVDAVINYNSYRPMNVLDTQEEDL